jgi:hypothetical protein
LQQLVGVAGDVTTKAAMKPKTGKMATDASRPSRWSNQPRLFIICQIKCGLSSVPTGSSMSGSNFFSCKYKYGVDEGHAESSLDCFAKEQRIPLMRSCDEEADLTGGQGSCL